MWLFLLDGAPLLSGGWAGLLCTDPRPLPPRCFADAGTLTAVGEGFTEHASSCAEATRHWPWVLGYKHTNKEIHVFDEG